MVFSSSDNIYPISKNVPDCTAEDADFLPVGTSSESFVYGQFLWNISEKLRYIGYTFVDFWVTLLAVQVRKNTTTPITLSVYRASIGIDFVFISGFGV